MKVRLKSKSILMIITLLMIFVGCSYINKEVNQVGKTNYRTISEKDISSFVKSQNPKPNEVKFIDKKSAVVLYDNKFEVIRKSKDIKVIKMIKIDKNNDFKINAYSVNSGNPNIILTINNNDLAKKTYATIVKFPGEEPITKLTYQRNILCFIKNSKSQSNFLNGDFEITLYDEKWNPTGTYDGVIVERNIIK
ncbi:hypothetical protein CLPU_8c01370 [Gottschalkia purinilytica]|uniref:Lipoprotein n=1 Tax=Gottschalkia purinilytica TaxID=1503 RepID=A0A0L0WAA3_GOTPU|nr:hypothetical protein [Gottschalkia purinilytica]KNF08372.1 hypothetical protein CLPU_8c01370 [Gottschalkia purinilytica]